MKQKLKNLWNYFTTYEKIWFISITVLAFVFGAMDSVMNELPPMTEFAPMTVLPPRMDAPE